MAWTHPNSRDPFNILGVREAGGIYQTMLYGLLQCLVTHCYSLLPRSILFLMTCVNGTFVSRQGLRARTNLVYSNKVKIKTVGYTIENESYAEWDRKMHCQLSMRHFCSLPSSSLRSSLPAWGSGSPMNWAWVPGAVLPEGIADVVFTLPPLRNHAVNVPSKSGSSPYSCLTKKEGYAASSGLACDQINKKKKKKV